MSASHKTARADPFCEDLRIRHGQGNPAPIPMKPQPELSTQEVLAGLVERVTYHNAENGFWFCEPRHVAIVIS